MRRIAEHLPFLFMCAALLMLARPVLAQTPHVDAGAVCEQGHYIKPSDLLGIAGTYDLSNGDVLYVSSESRAFFAEIGKVGRMQIIPLNDKEFVEKGGPLRFSFDRNYPWSDVTIAGLDAPRTGIDPCRR